MGWQEFRKSWHDTSVDYCDVCGNLLIHRYFEFTGADGEVLRACREDDERLHHQLRRYRPDVERARAGEARQRS